MKELLACLACLSIHASIAAYSNPISCTKDSTCPSDWPCINNKCYPRLEIFSSTEKTNCQYSQNCEEGFVCNMSYECQPKSNEIIFSTIENNKNENLAAVSSSLKVLYPVYCDDLNPCPRGYFCYDYTCYYSSNTSLESLNLQTEVTVVKNPSSEAIKTIDMKNLEVKTEALCRGSFDCPLTNYCSEVGLCSKCFFSSDCGLDGSCISSVCHSSSTKTNGLIEKTENSNKNNLSPANLIYIKPFPCDYYGNCPSGWFCFGGDCYPVNVSAKKVLLSLRGREDQIV